MSSVWRPAPLRVAGPWKGLGIQVVSSQSSVSQLASSVYSLLADSLLASDDLDPGSHPRAVHERASLPDARTDSLGVFLRGSLASRAPVYLRELLRLTPERDSASCAGAPVMPVE